MQTDGRDCSGLIVAIGEDGVGYYDIADSGINIEDFEVEIRAEQHLGGHVKVQVVAQAVIRHSECRVTSGLLVVSVRLSPESENMDVV